MSSDGEVHKEMVAEPAEIRSEVIHRLKSRIGGDDSQVEGNLIEALRRLPEDVRNFALDECFFVAVGRPDDGGFFVSPESLRAGAEEPRRLVVLNSSWQGEDFQSAVAHEVAHLWLEHPEFGGPYYEHNEDAAAALVRKWGFTGTGSVRFGDRKATGA
jgi:hypothetical protein